MLLTERAELMDSAEVGSRVRMALLVAAAAVFSEASTTPNHTARVTWAARVLSGDGLAERRTLSYLVGQADPTAALLSDAALQGFVNGLVTPLALLPG